MSMLKAPRLLKTQNVSVIWSMKHRFSDKKSKKNDDDDKISKPQENNKKEVAANRLSALLSSMPTESDLKKLETFSLPMAKPKKKIKQKLDKPQNIFTAVKEVASELGGDSKQTEIDLLSKLLNSTSTEDQNASIDLIPKSKEHTQENLSLSDIITGMKIDKPADENFSSRSEYVRNTLKKQIPKQYNFQQKERTWNRQTKDEGQKFNIQPSRVDLFGEKPLGIFTNITDFKNESPIENEDIWNKLQQRELKLAVMHPPSNYFQKMALWTNQGKLWKFPIDNEQGLDDEAKIPFTEHIFLEKHLESWCPKKGPIRHFMELVCVGLSKNPYYTVQQKREHIEWFQKYFNEKKDILEKVIIDNTATKTAKTISENAPST